VACPRRTLGTTLTGVIGALTLSAPDSVFLTVRQADRHAFPGDLVAPSVSADGRYVAFSSFARLAPADTNDRRDIYVLDRFDGTVTIESLSPDGRPLDSDSVWPRITGDGRFVVYEAMQERPGHSPVRVIALRDRRRTTTTLVQRRGEAPDRSSREPAISSDGRVVVFSSCATNLSPDTDINGAAEDVYAFDTSTGGVERVDIGTDGRQPPSGASFAPSVSADGRYVAFTSTSNLDVSSGTARGAPHGIPNVYLRDLQAHVTRRISVRRDGGAPDGPSYGPAISGDGRHVAFISDAANLVAGDDNRLSDVFLRDVPSRTTLLVSRSTSGGSANGASRNPAIAGNGNSVAFQSDASDLTCARRCPDDSKDINLVSDIFLFDRISSTTVRISTGHQSWIEPSAAPGISATGAVVAFSSRHPTDANDTDNDFDLFVWMDRAVSLTYRVGAR
jgi:Tol biopolymer transport system component